MAKQDQKHKTGRRQPRFRAPSSGSISTELLPWPELEAACSLTFSDEARRRILWAQGNLRAMCLWPTMTRSEFFAAVNRVERAISGFHKAMGKALDPRNQLGPRGINELDDPSELLGCHLRESAFATAIRAALVRSGLSETGIEWDEASEALINAVDRIEVLLRNAPEAPYDTDRWPEAAAWERYVAAIAEAFQHDGHPITANDAPETPLVTFLRMTNLKGHGAPASFARHIQHATKKVREAALHPE